MEAKERKRKNKKRKKERKKRVNNDFTMKMAYAATWRTNY